MSQEEVYNWFTLYFPQFAKHVTEWFPNGRNSVRIRQASGQDFVFTYRSKTDWRFETVESFIRTMKGENKMC